MSQFEHSPHGLQKVLRFVGGMTKSAILRAGYTVQCIHQAHAAGLIRKSGSSGMYYAT